MREVSRKEKRIRYWKFKTFEDSKQRTESPPKEGTLEESERKRIVYIRGISR